MSDSLPPFPSSSFCSPSFYFSFVLVICLSLHYVTILSSALRRSIIPKSPETRRVKLVDEVKDSRRPVSGWLVRTAFRWMWLLRRRTSREILIS